MGPHQIIARKNKRPDYKQTEIERNELLTGHCHRVTKSWTAGCCMSSPSQRAHSGMRGAVQQWISNVDAAECVLS